MTTDLSLTLLESLDVEDGIVRLDQADMRQLSVVPGDVVAVEGVRLTYLVVQSAFIGDHNQRLVRVSALTAQNLGVRSGQVVRFIGERVRAPIAELVTLETEDDIDKLHVLARQQQIGDDWSKRVITVGDMLGVSTLDTTPLRVKAVSVQPQGAVQIVRATGFKVVSNKEGTTAAPQFGGLRGIYRTCQFLIKARFTRPYDKAAHSILLSGPSGCGQSRLIKRLALDAGVDIHVMDIRSVLDKTFSSGNPDLSGLLPELARRGKTILFIDHLEALNEASEVSSGYSSPLSGAAHSVLVQLRAMLDEITTQPNIMVFATSSIPLVQPKSHKEYFDICLTIDAPNRWGRAEWLLVATEKMELSDDVDISYFATISMGMTGRDILKMCDMAQYLSVGSKVTVQDMTAAFRATAPSAASEIICDVPTTSWDEVVGLDDIKTLLRETLTWSLNQFRKFAMAGIKPPRSILLSGGQGTGKTSLVRALAARVPLHFIEISCPLLIAKHQADSFSFVQDSFALARRKAPCLIFLDDFDVLFGNGGNGDTAISDKFAVTQMISELDRIAAINGVVVIAATNRPDRLSPDILKSGRFDFAITLPMPDVAARKMILHLHARKFLLSADIDFEKLAGNTQGMSSMEIANLCNRVGLMALRQSLNSPSGGEGGGVVTSELFEQALRGRKN